VPKAESLYRGQASPPISKSAEPPCSSPPLPSRARPEKPYPVRSQLSQLGPSCWQSRIYPRKVMLFRKGTDVCDLVATLPQIRTYRGICFLHNSRDAGRAGVASVQIDLPFGPLPTHDPAASPWPAFRNWALSAIVSARSKRVRSAWGEPMPLRGVVRRCSRGKTDTRYQCFASVND
jgi:hypothetical protein